MAYDISKINKWREWIKRIRDEQLLELMTYQAFNRDYERIVNANDELPKSNLVLRYFRAVYASYAAMAVRRQARQHKDSVSLDGLLADMAENHKDLTRTWLRTLY